MHSSYKKMGLAFLLLFSVIHSYSQEARDIINRYLDTVSYHDVGKWRKVKTFYAERVGYYNVDEKNLANEGVEYIPIYGKLYRQWPDKTKEELYPDSTFTLIGSEFLYSKERHTMRIGNIPATMEPNESIWFQFFPVLVQNWLADSKSVTYNGTKNLPNEKLICHEVALVTKKIKRTLYFNRDTYLLEAFFVPEENTLVRLSGYKKIDGYLFPTSEIGLKGAVLLRFWKYTAVKFNPELPPKIFDGIKFNDIRFEQQK